MLQVRNLLLALDFSPSSEAAIPYALSLADQFGATLHVLHAKVLRREPDSDRDVRNDPSQVQKRLNDVLGPEALRERGLEPEDFDIRFEIERDVEPAPAVLNYAEEHDIDCLVMGTHGRRGVRRLLIGSVAEEVVRLAPCPVLTVREQEVNRVASPNEILTPIDYSEHSKIALEYARELADLYDARLTLLHVVEEYLHPAFYGPQIQSIYDADPDIEEKARDHLETFYRGSGGPEIDVSYQVRSGRAAGEIRQAVVDGKADLVVMSTHGRTGMENVLMGSVASRVVRTAPCPVLTIKPSGRSLFNEGASS